MKTFFPPFLLAFGVVMFVLTMQSMWKFIDDVIGKGASVWMIIEFVLYLSISLIPLALPAAILLSSLMLMGNLSERYELTSMKSAGISLWRLMMPLMVVTLGIGAFSFVCSNNIVPVAMLKFKTRLFNFKSQKLALNLEEGVFNDDFRNFSIRIGKKDDDTGELEDIMLYDHSADNRNRAKIILSEKGRMDLESDERFLIMRLGEGRQYQEMEEDKTRKRDEPRKFPYLRIHFGELEKYLDLKEFEMNDVDDDLFKEQEDMLTVRQLVWELDTLRQKMETRNNDLARVAANYLHFIKTSDTSAYYLPLSQAGSRELSDPVDDAVNIPNQTTPKRDWQPAMPPSRLERPGAPKPAKPTTTPPKPKINRSKPPQHNQTAFNGTPERFDEVMLSSHRKKMYDRAATAARSIHQKANEHLRKEERQLKKERRFVYAAHLKFSLAVACMIFLFIGAPLGAIIRKGGFGYPVLFGVVMFVMFIALVVVFKKIAVADSLPHPALGAWIPVFIFLIPSFFLTWGAVRDAKAMNLDLIMNKIQKLLIGGDS